MERFISDLDSKRFGFKVAKFNNWEDSVESRLDDFRKANCKLIITRVPCEDIHTINLLEKAGFEIKDTQLTYQHSLKNIDCDMPTSLIFREAQAQDLPLLQNIAKNAFMQYGHYFANNRLDTDKTQAIYEDWVTRSLQDPEVADSFCVACTSTNDIAGFLSYKLLTKGHFKYAAGGIGAVAETYQNQGIFKLLLKQGLLWGKEKQLDWIEHNALVTNYPVAKAFVACGFYSVASFVTLHAWLD